MVAKLRQKKMACNSTNVSYCIPYVWYMPPSGKLFLGHDYFISFCGIWRDVTTSLLLTTPSEYSLGDMPRVLRKQRLK